MTWLYITSGILAILLFCYLVYALLKAEDF